MGCATDLPELVLRFPCGYDVRTGSHRENSATQTPTHNVHWLRMKIVARAERAPGESQGDIESVELTSAHRHAQRRGRFAGDSRAVLNLELVEHALSL
jgi:hypothetical protein